MKKKVDRLNQSNPFTKLLALFALLVQKQKANKFSEREREGNVL